MDEIIVKARTLAAMIHVSERRVSQLADDGIVLKGKRRGEYLLHESTQRYIAFLKAGGTEREVRAQQEAAKLELITEQIREKKRANDIEDELIAPINLIREVIISGVSKILPILESLPLEMKRRNPMLTGSDITIAKKSIAKCCSIMADTKAEIKGGN